MPVLEARPEIAEQQIEAVVAAGDQPAGAPLEGPPHPETPADMTSEQAIKACPFLGRLAMQNPELAKQKAQEYTSDPDKMAELHLGEEDREREPEEEDSFWDDLEADFATDEETAGSENTTPGKDSEKKEAELFENLGGESTAATEPDSDSDLTLEIEFEPDVQPETATTSLSEGIVSAPRAELEPPLEPELLPDPTLAEAPAVPPEAEKEIMLHLEPATTSRPAEIGLFALPHLEGQGSLAQQAASERQLRRRSAARRIQHAGSKEKSKQAVDVRGVVRTVIGRNRQASKDFRSGDTEALKILVGDAMRLSKAA